LARQRAVTNKLGSVPHASKRLSLPAVATLVVIKDEAAKSLLSSGLMIGASR
jgi:hypothetical protein